MKYLNEKQREIVDENYKLIHGAIKRFQAKERLGHILEPDDIEQVAALALCEAVQCHDPEKAQLSTYAYTAINNAFNYELKKYIRRNSEVLGLEEVEHMATEDTGLYKADIEIAMEGAKQRYRGREAEGVRILIMKLDGYHTKEIEEILGKSKDWVYRTICKAKSRLKKDSVFLREAGLV